MAVRRRTIIFIISILLIMAGALSLNIINARAGVIRDVSMTGRDNKKPVIRLNGRKKLEIEKGQKLKLSKVTAYDNRDGRLTKEIKVKVSTSAIKKKERKRLQKAIKNNKAYTYNKAGKYVISYTVKDKAGNIAKKKRYVIVREPDIWCMTQHGDASGNQSMFYTFCNKRRDKLIVIDGGWPDNTQYVRDVIMGYGGHVDAWICTHYHIDHVSAFNEIIKSPMGITVDAIYASPMDYDEYVKIAKEWDTPQSFTDFRNNTKGLQVDYLKEGDCFDIANLSFKVFNSYTKDVALYGDIPNNGSLMFKITGDEDSILFCSDCRSKILGKRLAEKYGTELHAKYVQPGHHGNGGFAPDFYDVVDPQIALFDAPEWLMTGDSYDAKDLKAYFIRNNVKVFDHTTAPNVFEFR